ncbi:ubiquitin 3 binding protein But2 C-terminal domain-containing protein [Daldinia bambusicola]|nr:ubiquitin 3 binding protein But2 C-terminal domain-containing protein [Daldinia bambusicola]
MLLRMILLAVLTSATSVKSISPAPIQINAGCSFHLTMPNGHNGTVGQLADGQIRVGSDMTPSLFTWFGDYFTDYRGRGCWWTPPSLVLQCDLNQAPNHGFVIGCYGGVSYQHHSLFYECQTGDGDEVNLYLEPNGADCSSIALRADSCRPACASASFSSRHSTATTATTARTAGASSTSTVTPLHASASHTLQTSSHSGTATTSSSASTSKPTPPSRSCEDPVFERPDEVILVDKGKPDTANGLNPNMIVQLTPNVSAIFVFDFNSSDSNKQCSLVFDLPSIQDQQHPLYTLNGTGLVSFALLEDPPDDPANTTYNNAPPVAMPLEAVNLEPGISAQPLEFPCPGEDGHVVVAMRDRPGSGVYLHYLEGRSEVPVGLYLLKC